MSETPTIHEQTIRIALYWLNGRDQVGAEFSIKMASDVLRSALEAPATPESAQGKCPSCGSPWDGVSEHYCSVPAGEVTTEAAAREATFDAESIVDEWAALPFPPGATNRVQQENLGLRQLATMAATRAARPLESKIGALAEELKSVNKDLAQAKRDLGIVRVSDHQGVWYWQGDGGDNQASLVCPVVMSADKLREMMGNTKAMEDRVKELERAFESIRLAIGAKAVSPSIEPVVKLADVLAAFRAMHRSGS